MTLEQRILAHSDAYYNGMSTISDADFDRIRDELGRKNPKSPVLEAVGAPPKGCFPRAAHIIPMGSLNKAVNDWEFNVWAERFRPSSCVAQYKLDGASLELQYDRGKLVRAVTRGDGATGSDITANARRMKGVLPETDTPFSGGVRGEVVMPRRTWEEKYPGRHSPRDTGNGIMLRKDGAGCEDLVFIAYDAGAAGNDGFFAGEPEKMAWLEARGFAAVNSLEFTDSGKILAWRDTMAKRRFSLPVDIDGLVIKDGKTDMADLRRPRPARQIALKFQ
jgi:DNA ligase (NAD+)